jgi:hypothetical protein
MEKWVLLYNADNIENYSFNIFKEVNQLTYFDSLSLYIYPKINRQFLKIVRLTMVSLKQLKQFEYSLIRLRKLYYLWPRNYYFKIFIVHYVLHALDYQQFIRNLKLSKRCIVLMATMRKCHVELYCISLLNATSYYFSEKLSHNFYINFLMLTHIWLKFTYTIHYCE